MILLDTSLLVSFEVQKDINHRRALTLMDEIVKGEHGPPLISDYIFDETVTVTLVRSGSLHKATMVGEALNSSFQILRVDESIFDSAWQRFKAQKQTKLSFTDCTNITLMQRNGIGEVATFDKEYRKVSEIIVIS